MKTIQKIALLLILTLSYNCKAQRINDTAYINYYNNVSSKLNTMATTKTQFYNQNFASFYSEILNNNLTIVSIGIDSKIANSNQIHILTLEFAKYNMIRYGLDKGYQHPVIDITFANEVPNQILDLLLQYQGKWNNTYQQFFANMLIESIAFGGTNGYNNPDRTPR